MGAEQAIPFTAWQQAVFVVLFVVFVIGLLAWVDRLLTNLRKEAVAREEAQRKFQAEESQKMREFLREQNSNDERQNGAVVTSIEGLTEAIGELLREFRSHDAWEHGKLDEMSKKIHEPITQPRRGKQA